MDRRSSAPGENLEMTTFLNETWTGDSSRRILIVEAAAGANRRRWAEDRLQEMAQAGTRAFSVCCDFDAGGAWAGVSELFASLLPEIKAAQPNLLERHAFELVNILPRLRRSLEVRNPNLTDLAPASERTRNYPADRAFRNVHGLIDLLDSWKSAVCPEELWVISCDRYDAAGAMSGLFFRELMRRRGDRLHIRLVAAVDPGNGEETKASFSPALQADVISVNMRASPRTVEDRAAAARTAGELEEQIGDDRVEMQARLAELIQLWRLAGRADKLFRYKRLGFETYHMLGLYADSLRYADGLLELAAEHAPDNDLLQWVILYKLMMSHISLQDVRTSLRLAERVGLELVEQHPEWGIQLFYAMAMFYARFQKPRDLAKGEEYLERSLAAIEEANLEEGDYHFNYVFNRNGLAMIRNFQGRYQEAIELCRNGIAQLNAHLGADQHRLHRSILVYNIGQVYAATGAYNEAIEHYSVAIAMDPNYSEYYNDRGSAYLQIGRLQEAHADYLKAIELSPPYFEVFANLGQCYRRMGAMAEAIEAYSRAIDIEPGHLLALLGRAKAHEESAHVAEAISDYTAALTRDPTQWEAVASRGVMHYEAGDLRASLADFNRAIELKPNQCDLHQNRATVLTKLGRYHEAARDLQVSLSLDPPEEDREEIEARLATLFRTRLADQRSSAELLEARA
jgi:tetratricopeptide (TPR) repeat protein